MSGIIAWLAQTPLSQGLAQNALAFPVLEVVHVLAISLVLGLVTIFDIRLLGLGWRDWPANALLVSLRKVTLIGFALAALSGGALFLSQPQTYAQNAPFLIKLSLLAAAGVNLLAFEGLYGRKATAWTQGAIVPRGARLSALLSLTLWGGVLVSGRLIGFFLMA